MASSQPDLKGRMGKSSTLGAYGRTNDCRVVANGAQECSLLFLWFRLNVLRSPDTGLKVMCIETEEMKSRPICRGITGPALRPGESPMLNVNLAGNSAPQTNAPRGTFRHRAGSDMVDLDPYGYILMVEWCC